MYIYDVRCTHTGKQEGTTKAEATGLKFHSKREKYFGFFLSNVWLNKELQRDRAESREYFELSSPAVLFGCVTVVMENRVFLLCKESGENLIKSCALSIWGE